MLLSVVGIESHVDANGEVRYYCILFRSRPMRYVASHVNSPQHQAAVSQINTHLPTTNDTIIQVQPIHLNETPMTYHDSYHQDDVHMFSEDHAERHDTTNDLEDQKETDLIPASRGAFAGDSDDSKVEEIKFNPNFNISMMIAQQLFSGENLPGDVQHQSVEPVSPDGTWFPFRSEEVIY